MTVDKGGSIQEFNELAMGAGDLTIDEGVNAAQNNAFEQDTADNH